MSPIPNRTTPPRWSDEAFDDLTRLHTKRTEIVARAADDRSPATYADPVSRDSLLVTGDRDNADPEDVLLQAHDIAWGLITAWFMLLALFA